MTVDVAGAAAALQAADDILILTHRRPDGDTTGCAGALCRALRQIGKTAYILENPEITRRYAPELVFELDNSITHGAHISEMLHELKNEGKLGGEDDGE